MKNSSDTIRNQTCDLPACNAVPQPNSPLRTPTTVSILNYIKITCQITTEIYCPYQLFTISFGQVGHLQVYTKTYKILGMLNATLSFIQGNETFLDKGQ